MMKKGVYLVFSVFLVLFMLSVVSAGFTDWFRTTITGKATSQTTTTSITLTGINAVSIQVFNASLTGAAVDPTEAGTNNIIFNITVTDADGINDINDSSVTATITNSGQTRQNTTACTQIAGESTTTSQNYTCSMNIYYFDAPGTWTINVTATDFGNLTYISNDDKVFSYDTLTAMVISPSTINWPESNPGDVNVTATQNTTINNTGNYNVDAGNVQVKGINLYGASGSYIDAANFTVDVDSGIAACNGQALVNGTDQGITVANITRGNLSAGSGQEVLFYCFNLVPSNLPSEAYSTSQSPSEAWTIKIV